jgi:hypothetical protein
VRAITGAKAFVLVLSESAIASSHVSREIERAASKRRPIIALRIDAAPLTPALEYFLSESQWATAEAANIDAAYAKLIESIRAPARGSPESLVAAAPERSAGTASVAHRKSRRNRIKSQDLRAIGIALGVSYVVEGSVRRSGERLRVTAQLIKAQDGSHAWSETYDEPVGDTLKVQDQIASNLARALQVTLGADYQPVRPSFKSAEAYDFYLRGRHAYDREDKEGLESAAAYFQ